MFENKINNKVFKKEEFYSMALFLQNLCLCNLLDIIQISIVPNFPHFFVYLTMNSMGIMQCKRYLDTQKLYIQRSNQFNHKTNKLLIKKNIYKRLIFWFLQIV